MPTLERQDQVKLEEEDLKDEGVESDGNNWDQVLLSKWHEFPSKYAIK